MTSMPHNLAPQNIGIGALAGLAFALLSIGSANGSVLSMILFFLSPFPILLTTMSWGLVTGVFASIVGLVGISIFAIPMSALIVGLISALPALIAGHLVGLARPAEEMGGQKDMMLWYPLSEILGRVSLAIAIGFVAVGIAVGYNEALSQEMAALLVQNFSASGQTLPQEVADNLAATLFKLIPMVQPGTWLLAFIGNLYLAIKIAQKSDLFARPDDDWRRALRMPAFALVVFSGAIIVMFLGGSIAAAAAAIAGALGTGYMIAGLAATHHKFADNPAKSMILFVIYLALAVFLPLAFIFVIIGLFEKATSAPLSKTPQS